MADNGKAGAIKTGALGASKSIAGKLHGAKQQDGQQQQGPSQANPQEWRPQLAGLVHPEVEKAFRVIFDNQYEMRNKANAGAATAADNAPAKGAAAQGGKEEAKSPVPTSAMASGIHGLRIKAVPPTHGQTLVYNGATGEIEWT